MKNEKGQSLLEMVIGLSVILLLLFATVDFGRVYFTYIALEDAAGEAALYLSINPNCSYDGVVNGINVADDDNPSVENGGTDTDKCSPPNNAMWRAQNSIGSNINLDNATIVFENSNETIGTGNLVKVTITYKLKTISPIISSILPEFTLTSTATQMIFCESSCGK